VTSDRTLGFFIGSSVPSLDENCVQIGGSTDPVAEAGGLGFTSFSCGCERSLFDLFIFENMAERPVDDLVLTGFLGLRLFFSGDFSFSLSALSLGFLSSPPTNDRSEIALLDRL